MSNQAWEGGFTDEKIEQIKGAMTEALTNVVNFACGDGTGDITIKCSFFETYALIVDIIDTGKRFNMLVAGAFPETMDFVEDGQIPTLKQLKRTVRTVEYRRDGELNKNILTCTIPR